jgi:CIC family chloride channel protein
VFVPLIVAAVAGTLTSHAIRGEHLTFQTVQHGEGMLAEMLFFVALAALAGLIGTAFGRAMIATTRWFDRLRVPTWVKPAIGALGVGLLAALVSNELLGPGHPTLVRALDGSLGWKLALALGSLKMVATALTVGSGGCPRCTSARAWARSSACSPSSRSGPGPRASARTRSSAWGRSSRRRCTRR